MSPSDPLVISSVGLGLILLALLVRRVWLLWLRRQADRSNSAPLNHQVERCVSKSLVFVWISVMVGLLAGAAWVQPAKRSSDPVPVLQGLTIVAGLGLVGAIVGALGAYRLCWPTLIASQKEPQGLFYKPPTIRHNPLTPDEEINARAKFMP